jgi:hypothetical protein
MEDARYQDTLGFNPVKHNMASVFHAAQPFTNTHSRKRVLLQVCKFN